MKVIETPLPDLLMMEPMIFRDERGFFLESWNDGRFREATGIDVRFVQDNHSHSRRGVLRGLHYQLRRPQGKLVRAATGRVLDVAVDLRQSSPTFGRHFSVELSGKNGKQLWIPPGFAHGFLVLGESAHFLYKTTDDFVPDDQHHIRWDDPDLAIDWHLQGLSPLLSEKDRAAPAFKDASLFP